MDDKRETAKKHFFERRSVTFKKHQSTKAQATYQQFEEDSEESYDPITPSSPPEQACSPNSRNFSMKKKQVLSLGQKLEKIGGSFRGRIEKDSNDFYTNNTNADDTTAPTKDSIQHNTPTQKKSSRKLVVKKR